VNFLAHAYLSFDDPKILVGNFIGDFVRGDIESRFEPAIVHGIYLHREIDNFTDSHPTVKAAQKLLKPQFGRYALVITDLYFDYFLSTEWSNYDYRSLTDFSLTVYDVLEEHRKVLPKKFLHIFEYMKKQNWLICYATMDGMKTAFTNMSKRAAFESRMELAHLVLEEKEEVFREFFNVFFPELISFSKDKISELKAGI